MTDSRTDGLRFVVAVDGSAESEHALEHAARLADDSGAVTLVHVVNPDVFEEPSSDPVSGIGDVSDRIVATVEDAEKRGERVLESARSLATELGVTVESELLYGSPATEIASFAATDDFDGVFVGHRGKSERVERLLGSVAKDLVEMASCPVTVVR
ncbi:universal stress protein [Halorubrum lacusprofundi]|jgi:nucleotide-binding universal stress UspA family protein|uniref:UspA domain protein n=1 Tax=Halorubrum lacusprofundi (strain ATCC 49239 / DSM 5036 / JCM 8891 / ACAM 34) TaxID=416348 RepID=B9LWZ9_HALLT|nr:universal stress protein [Halorubrum lacusprofundi]ACM58990.1 UspA domain protein [Halorubrum lacusprofundi ATCC 49239]MCG1007622.1 universal stress protein [Halorubrum lacusprofundi]